jgi:hypothetical protein
LISVPEEQLVVSLSILREYSCRGGLYSSPKGAGCFDPAELEAGTPPWIGREEGPADGAAGGVGTLEGVLEGALEGASVGALEGSDEALEGAVGDMIRRDQMELWKEQ